MSLVLIIFTCPSTLHYFKNSWLSQSQLAPHERSQKLLRRDWLLYDFRNPSETAAVYGSFFTMYLLLFIMSIPHSESRLRTIWLNQFINSKRIPWRTGWWADQQLESNRISGYCPKVNHQSSGKHFRKMHWVALNGIYWSRLEESLDCFLIMVFLLF